MESATYRALLIANSFFPQDPQNLIELEGPRKDPLVLNNVLCDPVVGLFDSLNVRLLQERPRVTICAELARFFDGAKRDDVLVVYYSGHGVLDDHNRLYLCANDTLAERDLLEPTAVSAEWINGLIDDSATNACIVVLDCCHAGAFFKGGDLASSFRGSGRYAVMSCRTGELVRDATPNGTSYFTQYFSEALKTVDDHDGDGYVGLAEVFQVTRNRLVAEKKQRPTIGWKGEEGDIILARRPTAPPGPPPGPITAPVRAVGHPLPAPGSGRAIEEGPPRPRGVGRNRTVFASVVVVLAAIALVAVLNQRGPSRPTGRQWDLTQSPEVLIAPSAAGGTVTLGSTAARATEFGNLTTRCSFGSDFDVQVSYALVWPPGSNGTVLGIVGVASPQRFKDVSGPDYYVVNADQPLPGIGPPSHGPLIRLVPTADRIGQLRLKRVGSTYSGYARGTPAEAWTFLGATMKPPIVPTRISLSVWGQQAKVTRSVTFTDFQVLGGSCRS